MNGFPPDSPADVVFGWEELACALADAIADGEASAPIDPRQSSSLDQHVAKVKLSRQAMLFGLLESRGLTHELISERRKLIDAAPKPHPRPSLSIVKTPGGLH